MYADKGTYNQTFKNNKNVRFQAVAVKDTKALESKYE
jgi:hypothetical protein